MPYTKDDNIDRKIIGVGIKNSTTELIFFPWSEFGLWWRGRQIYQNWNEQMLERRTWKMDEGKGRRGKEGKREKRRRNTKRTGIIERTEQNTNRKIEWKGRGS